MGERRSIHTSLLTLALLGSLNKDGLQKLIFQTLLQGSGQSLDRGA